MIRMKRVFSWFVGTVCIGMTLVMCGCDEPGVSFELDTAVGKAILEDNKDSYLKDAFTKISGSGTIPAVLNFDAEDGDGFEKSIREMFPIKYRGHAMRNSDSDREELEFQEYEYAQEYLINRSEPEE
ncbi:MAG: hypothetical protein PHN99_04280 [Eubacteriales bacterium]|nr:hypothetical protein [Eubacteriales bacterium]